MHYYKRNIGDYHKKAGRLSILEHGTYTLLMDACYDRERFPTLDEAIDWLWARSEEEIEAIKFVLDKFFELQEDGTYIQQRIKEELDAYHAMAETNKRIAKEREEKRRKKKQKSSSESPDNKGDTRNVHESCSSVNEAPPNQEPLTKNQEPRTTNQEPRTSNQENGSLANSDYAVGESIRDWIPPTLEQINARLVMSAPPVAAITKDQYAEYGRKFKNYFAEQELDGKYLRTESRRIDKLVDWVKREVGAFSKNRSNQSLNTPAPLGSTKVDITKRFAHLKKQGADA